MAPEAIIVAGPNGAGKSTVAYEFESELRYEYISADLIASQLSPVDPTSARFEAGRTFFRRLHGYIASGTSFVAETTLSGRTFVNVIRRLRSAGYDLRITYVFVDTPDLCVKRVQQRVLRGGHDVPEPDVRRRFYRSKRNFWQLYRPLVDRWYLYYNAESSFEEVALGDQEQETVIDEALFALFTQDLNRDYE